jgi:phosphoribosylamine--glycine ligase
MKIGLIGSGGREHALALALTRDATRHELYVYAGHANPGIARLAARVFTGELADVEKITDTFTSWGIELAVVGPELPLMAGMVDALRARGIPTVGATRAQARIEGDKAFMRDLLRRRVGWGSPAWQLVQTSQQAVEFISMVGEVAVKPVGLTGGKGVRVMGVHFEDDSQVLDYIEGWIKQDGRVLLEERLVGEEFSRMAFVSDGVIQAMPVAQDFKYAYDGDRGNMTGGMGAYTCADGSLPFIEQSDLESADRMMVETVAALQDETGEGYRGFLYGQFIATSDGVRVIEYNARLGDPEAINLMALLEADAVQLCWKIASGELVAGQALFSAQASVVKYLVPAGYPDDPAEPDLFGLDEAEITGSGFSVIYASVEPVDRLYRSLGSRTLAVVGLGDSPGQVSEMLEALLGRVQPAGLRHRTDIGDEQVIQGKLQRMIDLRKGRSGHA